MIITILLVIILIFSAILHEYAHGWMARRLGDDTAERLGRLTLNPLKHLDPIGSVLVPLLLIISRAPFFIAWAKPVPYNPNNLRDQKYGSLKVAAAGPLTNFGLAIIFGLITRFMMVSTGLKTQLALGFLSGNASTLALTSGSVITSLILIAMMACLVNLVLGIFNLIPVPPLDGSRILGDLLPESGKRLMYTIERYGFVILILLITTGVFNFVFTGALWAFSFLTGL